jgi:ferredoxin-NADP reductase/MOSC domain-containing protein YiiM
VRPSGRELSPLSHVVSVNVGLPRDHAWNGRTVHTGAWKEPVEGPRMVRRLGMEGDGQGDTYGHGGPHRAVLVYQLESYEYWRKHFDRPDIGPGMFAENLTIDGPADTEVFIGDRFRIGGAVFEVSQPRVTCFRAGLRLGRPDLAALLVAHHRPGFYMRVLTEGEVRAGDAVERIATGPGKVSVAAVDALLYLPEPDRDALRRALMIPALSPGWQGSLRELLDAAERPAAPAPTTPAWTGFRALKVANVVVESPAVTSFWLTAPDGEALPSAKPGQYLTIRVPGPGPATAIRSYSLSRSSDGTAYRISVKREPQGQVSNYLHAAVRRGDTLEAAAPRGEFVLATDGATPTAPVLLVSAGVGITPVLAMLHRLAADGSSRPVWWLHAARGPAELSFGTETQGLLRKLPNAHAFTFFSSTAAADGSDEHTDIPGDVRHERLSAAALRQLSLPADSVAYVCGPPGFMAAITSALAACGLSKTNIRTEAFGALAPVNPGIVGEAEHRPHLPTELGTGPTITFSRSGITAAFDETKKSILEFAEACDIPTRWQCRTGVCRTCETGIVAGEVTYSPEPLDKPLPGTFLPCCSRPATEVVLDM